MAEQINSPQSPNADVLVAILREHIPRRTTNLWEALATMLIARSAGALQSLE